METYDQLKLKTIHLIIPYKIGARRKIILQISGILFYQENYNLTSVDGKKLDGTAGQLVKPNELNIE